MLRRIAALLGLSKTDEAVTKRLQSIKNKGAVQHQPKVDLVSGMRTTMDMPHGAVVGRKTTQQELDRKQMLLAACELKNKETGANSAVAVNSENLTGAAR